MSLRPQTPGRASCRSSLLVAALAGFCLVACERAPELDDYGTVPDWRLEDQQGRAFGSADLEGQPWVANFLFTSCQSSCPPLAKASKSLQDRIRQWAPTGRAPARIVSISVDPVTDTPERLQKFAAEYGADPQVWSLVTTRDYQEMEALVVKGFMQPLIRKDLMIRDEEERQRRMAQATPIDTAHSVRFVLVDGEGRIRGLYAQSEEDLDALDDALRYLASQPGGVPR